MEIPSGTTEHAIHAVQPALVSPFHKPLPAAIAPPAALFCALFLCTLLTQRFLVLISLQKW